jgi:GNAT superfamily N-acetyltransferase
MTPGCGGGGVAFASLGSRDGSEPAAGAHISGLHAAGLVAGDEQAASHQRQAVGRDRQGDLTFAVEADGQVIGLIQYWEENEPDDRHAAIDILLHPDWQGRGLGADAIRTLARYLFEQRGHRRRTTARRLIQGVWRCSDDALQAAPELRPWRPAVGIVPKLTAHVYEQ